MGAVKSQLENSHEDELRGVAARYLADTAIKVETARLEAEQEWQQKLQKMKQDYELEIQTIAKALTQVGLELGFLTVASCVEGEMLRRIPRSSCCISV